MTCVQISFNMNIKTSITNGLQYFQIYPTESIPVHMKQITHELSNEKGLLVRIKFEIYNIALKNGLKGQQEMTF